MEAPAQGGASATPSGEHDSGGGEGQMQLQRVVALIVGRWQQLQLDMALWKWKR